MGVRQVVRILCCVRVRPGTIFGISMQYFPADLRDATVPGDLPPGRTKPPGLVIFVGAGPGRADLLTLRALDRLGNADVIVHDQLVPPAVLELAGSEAARISVSQLLAVNASGTNPGRQLGRWLAELASPGRIVVRLKGGDPTVFARLQEELEPIGEREIPFEIVPGITAAAAAAAAAAVPLTARDTASSLTIVTGHEAASKAAAIDYRWLADTGGTVVFYMGVEQAALWSAALVQAGRPKNTPVTFVSRCSWADQRVVETTLSACDTVVQETGLQSPAIAIVGSRPAAATGAARGGLAGRRLLVTRPAGQADEMIAEVGLRGGEAVHIPLIEIGPAPDPAAVEAAVAAAWSYDWIVFASGNGVRAFADCLRRSGRDARALGTARLAAIGPATRDALTACGLACDLVPDCYRSEGVLAAIADSCRRGRFLLIRADKGRELLRQQLEAAGHHVDEIAAYTSRPLAALSQEDDRRLRQFPCDWIVLTSSSIATAAVRLFGRRLNTWKIASISPITSATLAAAGYRPTVEAAAATATAILDAIEASERQPTAPGQENEAGGAKAAASPPPESRTG